MDKKVTGRRRRRRKLLLAHLKETIGYWELKEEALDIIQNHGGMEYPTYKRKKGD